MMCTMKDRWYQLSVLSSLFLGALLLAVPTRAQDSITVLMNGTLHVGNGEVIENAAIAMQHGKILWTADARVIKLDMTDMRTIDCFGKDIYPGFIAPNNTLGLDEIELVRATEDVREQGQFNPNARSLTVFNTDSRVIPTIRSNGVLVAQVAPRGGRISGTSSIFSLDGWNWEDAVIKVDDGVHITWPNSVIRRGWWAQPGGSSENKNYAKQVAEVHDYFEQAKSYCGSDPDVPNLRFEALCNLFDGHQALFIRANYVRDILAAISFAKHFDVKMVLVGGRDSWMITDELVEDDIAVILRRNHSLPGHPDDDVDQPYKTPKLLHDAGVTFCLSDDDFWQQRNLPFQAGTAVAYGLDYEEAVRSITSSTANILGIADRLGTVEEGKDATLIVSSGDALDVRTHHIEMAFIGGEEIELRNHQLDNYERYMEKYGLTD